MGIADIKPHPEYAMLVRQFNALKTLLICKEKVDEVRGKDWKIDEVARNTLESERAANALLTEENDRLRSSRNEVIEMCLAEIEQAERDYLSVDQAFAAIPGRLRSLKDGQ